MPKESQLILDYMVSYHRVQYQKKPNDTVLRKLSDGRTDRLMRVISQDTDVEHPTKEGDY